MPDIKNIILVARKETMEALNNRWFLLYALCFAVLAFFLLFIGSSKSEIAGYSAFGKTAASLINLIMLFVPLVSLVTGAITISGERENNTLAYLLSHPISKTEVLLGKFSGLLFSIWLTILFGFGLAGFVIALQGTGKGSSVYLVTILLSIFLSASFLSIGILVSVMSDKTSKSLGIAIFLWILFLIFGDLGIMGTTVAMDIGVENLFLITSLNPVEAFKIASILNLSSRFEILGPAAVFAVRNYGVTNIYLLLFSVLFLWVLIPLLISLFYFCHFRREEK